MSEESLAAIALQQDLKSALYHAGLYAQETGDESYSDRIAPMLATLNGMLDTPKGRE
jgi:hypothetical protein